ncbi:MAG: HAMP domain-containing protein, partial [Bacteroidetes bacterium]|nr:HAMP domain-containing protein [Bacteroidota bacterium]
RRYVGELRSAQYGWLEKQHKRIDEAISIYESLEKTDEEKAFWESFKQNNSEFKRINQEIVSLSREKDQLLVNGLPNDDPAVTSIDDKVFQLSFDSRKYYLECDKLIINIIEKTKIDAATAVTTIEEDSTSAELQLIILVIVGAIISLLFGWYIAKLVSNPMKRAVEVLGESSMGHLDARMEIDWQDEIGDMARKMDSFTKGLQDMVKSMHSVANGDLSVYITPRDNRDEIAPALNKIVTTLKELKSETDVLTNAALKGELNKRGNSNIFQGGYKDIIEGFNNTLAAIVTPLKETQKTLEILSTGDLRVKMQGKFEGDFEELKNYVNHLSNSLSNLIGQITDAIEATASASNQISASAEEMAAGAEQQSAQITEVASAVEEMTSTIIENTKNISTAAEKAKETGDIAKSGGKVVNQTVEGMNKIADVVENAGSTVDKLGRNSDQIGEIIQVINDIADQTNLLALNAAIEAARAGEQGRGFAVVADEVRKLAERTTKATKEIGEMIKQIQVDTRGAVESMERGRVEVENGKKLADEAGNALQKIIHSATELVDLVTQVATASEEQSTTAEAISHSIEGISNVIHESTTGTQQIARASEDLNRLTDNLQNLITAFKVDQNNSLIRRK